MKRLKSEFALLVLLLWLGLPVAALSVAGRDPVRMATFNISFFRDREGKLIEDLKGGDHEQALKIAEIIQWIDPDVILLNEFDYDEDHIGIELFRREYLEVGQGGREPVRYPHVFTAPSNTGVDSGFDLDDDGKRSGVGADAFGFGMFPGQYGMAILSKHPIERSAVRTFRKFPWKDMPGALLPEGKYDAEEREVLRLSSKSHWDVPVTIDGKTVHLLASHPTPPVFDDGTDRDLDGFKDSDGITPIHDWNGRRNSDEIRFWADYVDPEKSKYIRDDEGGAGGLEKDTRFVVLGDLNADPDDGDSSGPAIGQLLESGYVNASFTPESDGAEAYVSKRRPGYSNPRGKTASFSARVDYVLPSAYGLEVVDGAVFWPGEGEDGHELVKASDHRLVYLDLVISE